MFSPADSNERLIIDDNNALQQEPNVNFDENDGMVEFNGYVQSNQDLVSAQNGE